MSKPTITPELLARFRAYNAKHAAWGSLHIVLDDQNVRDSDVEFCVKFAQERGDAEGEELGKILLQMSKTQRLKIGSRGRA